MTAAFLTVRLAGRAGVVSPPNTIERTAAERAAIDRTTTNVVRLFALDRPHAARPELTCHWRLDDDGRLRCVWRAVKQSTKK